MKRLYLIVVSLFLLPAGARAQESIPTLDLTKPASCEDEEGGTVVGRIIAGVTHAPPPQRLPLDLRLVHIEPRPLIWFEDVTYEVELENVGDAPIQMPWGTECDVPRGNDPDKVTAWVQLMLDEDPDNTEFAGESFYGMLNDPGTLRSVAPGGKVRVRIKSHAFTCCSGGDPVAQKLKHLVYIPLAPNSRAAEAERRRPPKVIDVDVRAEFGFFDGPYSDHLNRKSLNMVPLKLTKRPAP